MGVTDGDRRLRRAELGGAAATVAAAEVAVVAACLQASLPWWAVVGAALVVAGPAGWTGLRIGRRAGVRARSLEAGETVLGTYTVRPPYTEHTPPAAHEGPRYQLMATSLGLRMWERSVLLWWHPWPELRVLTDGPRLRVHHGGEEIAAMLLEPPTAAREIRLIAERRTTR
ncbi:hypothetical protein [Streptomyces sp. SHP 1-2]|uniref:hypothetical protein n=1 Tax=Streptomyces sp. SHP 1-2 TaxID=2769489 RepID=UPI002238FBAC|nr:hypothetical protein [Streptomyces sp. SHP 1-2]